MKKTIFITGASSGLGKAATLLFAKNNWNVIATMRTPENETELSEVANITLLPLDVTNNEQIQETVKKALAIAKIDVVFNNAGFGLAGPFEGATDDQLTNQLNTNLLGVMRDRYYTVAIYSGQGWGVELLMWLTGIPTRIGFSSSAGKRFLTDVVADKAEQYPAHRYHDLLQGINVATPAPDLTIGIPKGDLDWAEGEQKRLGIKGSGYVLLHDGAQAAYPIERWKTIVQSFRQQQPNLPMVIAASSQNPSLTTALTADYPELKVTAPADFGKLAAMIAGANLMLCTESAPMHLAVALQVYTLALLNSVSSANLLPQTDKFAAIPSETGKLADIPPEQVLAKVWGG